MAFQRKVIPNMRKHCLIMIGGRMQRWEMIPGPAASVVHFPCLDFNIAYRRVYV